METERVNEESVEGNYVIELFEPISKKWKYITTEFSISVASIVMYNIHNATNHKLRILSRRSNNMVLEEI